MVKNKLVRKNSKIIRDSIAPKSKGSEPFFDDSSTVEEIDLAMRWYNQNYDSVQSKKWLIEYLNEIDFDFLSIKKIKSLSWHKSGLEIQNGNIINLKIAGFIARMYLRGLKSIPDKYDVRLKIVIEYCVKLYDKNTVVDTIDSKETDSNNSDNNNINIQENIKSQVGNLCSYLNGAIEDFYDNGFKTSINVYDWLKSKKVKGLIAKKIGDEFRPLLNEIDQIDLDDDLREGYSNFKKSDRKKYRNFIGNIIDDCERYSSNQNKQRKPRKKKPISIDKMVSKINYKKEDTDYKISSIDPTNIIGASSLWVFNTKYRKLGFYTSTKPAGLSIKGSSIQGFDEEKSIQKTIRKPEDILNIIVDGPKVSVKKKFISINAKEQKLNGRINRETILLRIIK